MSIGGVPETDGLERRVASLQLRNEELLQRAVNAEQVMAAFVRGEVDAVAVEASATPVLLHAAQEKLRANQHLLRAIFDGALDPMVLSDGDGRYVDANPSACELFALPLQQLLGRSATEFVGTELLSEAAYLDFREQGHMRGSCELLRLDGSRRLLEFSSVSSVSPGIDLHVLRDITDRSAAETAVQRSEARFRTLTEKSADVIVLVARDGRVLYVTPQITQMLGWSPEQLTGEDRIDYVFPEDRARVALEHVRLLKGARETSFECRAVHRDGSILWVEVSARNLFDDPNVGAIVANLRDITARVQAEETSRESHRRLEEAQAIAHVGSWASGLAADDTIAWTRECNRIFGVPEGTAVTVASFFAFVHDDDRERVRRASGETWTKNVPYDIAHQIVRPDGSVRWVQERAIVERGPDGQPIRMVGTVQDITEHHLAVEALRTSEAELRLLAEAMPQIVWIAHPSGGNVYCNQRWVDYTGLTLEQSLGNGWLAPFHPADNEIASKAWQRAQATGSTYTTECRLRRTDGAYRWWLTRGEPVRDASGTIVKWFGTCTDIDELKRAHARAGEKEALLRVTGHAARVGGWTVELREGRVTWSDEVCAMLELPTGTAPSLDVALDLYPPEFRETIRTHFEACARDGTPFDLELQVITARSRRIWVRAIGAAQRDASGAITSLSGALQDIDERRKLQDQLRQTQKMEAVGRLAGGVAHDFNNLLTVILSYADMALESLKPGDPLRDDMIGIRGAGHRATALTKQLLAFSRQQVLQPRVINLHDIVSGLKAMLPRLLGEDIELMVAEVSGLGSVLADPGQIEQVVMNLAVNARDAMPDGGKLAIATSNVVLDAAHVGRVGCRPGSYVMLRMSDTGTGMDAATLARMFEPFFTTKQTGKGTGLGLATVFGIVEQSGGHIEVSSELGQGTAFEIYFPRTEEVTGPSRSLRPPRVLRGSETILLVEDEELVRAVGCAILRRNGYTILEASNGGEAFLIAKDFAGTIDLLLTDVVMPRMNGRKLAEQLALERPTMKVLFASGYTDDAIVHHGVLNAGVAFLQKPFTPDSLLRRVREVLDSDAIAS